MTGHRFDNLDLVGIAQINPKLTTRYQAGISASRKQFVAVSDDPNLT